MAAHIVAVVVNGITVYLREDFTLSNNRSDAHPFRTRREAEAVAETLRKFSNLKGEVEAR